MDFVTQVRHYMVLFLLLPARVELLNINDCTQRWEMTEFTSYAYKVDCSNLGFTRVPAKLPELTSQL